MCQKYTRSTPLALLLSIASLACGMPAHAVLITADWLAPGDGLIVRDTATSIEWLNLTQTAGLSYAQVSGELGAGGGFDGWRYATNGEVSALFGDYFGISLAAGVLREAPAYLDPGVRLASETLSDGVSGGTDEVSGPNANYRLVGFSADVRLNGAHFAVGAMTRWSDTDYFTVKDPVGAFELSSWDPYGLVTDDFFAHEWIGSYLVRTSAVPVPAAAWLLGSGLVVLAGTARRRHKR